MPVLFRKTRADYDGDTLLSADVGGTGSRGCLSLGDL